jgi:hypothetical protein
MIMSVKSSRQRFPVDSLLVLQSQDSGPVTSTAPSSYSIRLDVVTTYWNSESADLQTLSVELDIASMDFSSGDETYTFNLEVATTPAFNAPVVVASQPAFNAGRHIVSVERPSIQDALGSNATDGYLRLKAVLGGTTPSVTYSAFVSG